MKDLYKIHEIARLFRLHPDTLRYYEEKGLLHPVRGESGYRMYTIQDVCTLNVIRALRELDLSTEDIRAYLERRSVEETLSLLDRQEALLKEKLAALRAARLEAAQRRARLERYRAVPQGQVCVIEEPTRPYVFLRENVILEKEIDFLLKKLEGQHQDYIKVIGSQTMGAVLDGESLKRGLWNHFSCVFFLTPPAAPGTLCSPPGSTPVSSTGAATTAWTGIWKPCSGTSGTWGSSLPRRPWSCTASMSTTPATRRSMSRNCRCW